MLQSSLEGEMIEEVTVAIFKYLIARDNLSHEILTINDKHVHYLVPKVAGNCVHELYNCPQIGHRDCKPCKEWKWNKRVDSIVY